MGPIPLQIHSNAFLNPIDLQTSRLIAEGENEIQSIIHDLKRHAPSHKIYAVLRALGIVNLQGILTGKGHCAAKNLAQDYSKRMEHFLKTPLQLNVKGTAWTVSIAIQEILDYLNQVDPCISADILYENSLFFWGFEIIDQTFKEWGIDLVEICGKEYVSQLKERMSQKPSSITIQYFVSGQNPNAITKLKRALVDCISKKIPFDPQDAEYENNRHIIVKHLHDLENCHYEDWLSVKFDHLDFLLPYIATSELIVKKEIDPKPFQSNPCASILLEDTHSQEVEFIFSIAIPAKKIRFAKDAIRAPLRSDLDPLQLNSYTPLLMQGVVDITCGIESPISMNSAHKEDWKKWIKGSIQGDVFLMQGFKRILAPAVIQKAQESLLKHPHINLGMALSDIIRPLMIEDLQADENFASTMAAGSFLIGLISAKDLQDFIQAQQRYLKVPMEENPFYYIGLAFLAEIPYSLVHALLQLVSLSLLEKNASSQFTDVFLNQQGAEDPASREALEPVLQLRLKSLENYFYFSFSIQPFQAIDEIFKHIKECHEHRELLQAIINCFAGTESKCSFYLENIFVAQFDNEFPYLFQKFIDHLKNNPSFEVRKLLLNQFCGMLSKSTRISEREIKYLDRLREKISQFPLEKKNFLGVLIPVLKFMAQSQDHVLNQTAYASFQQLSSAEAKSKIAIALCRGNICNAANTFMRVSKEKLFTVKQRLYLFESICATLQNKEVQEILYYIDLLSLEIDNLIKEDVPLPYSNWVSDQLILIGRKDLAKKVRALANPSEEEPSIKKVETNKTPSPSIPEEVTHKSLEEITELIIESLQKNHLPGQFYKIAQMFKDPSLQRVFNNDREETLCNLYLPVLRQAINTSRIDGYLLCGFCLDFLKEFKPSPHSLNTFVDSLKMLVQNYHPLHSIPKSFKRSLTEAQNSIFKMLEECGKDQNILDLAYYFSLHQIACTGSMVPILHRAMSNVLEKKPSNENSLRIHVLLNQTAIKSLHNSHPDTLAAVYKLLAQFSIEDRFDYALDNFKKFNKLSGTPDRDLTLQLIDACKQLKHRKYFAQLTLLIDTTDEMICERWNYCFGVFLVGLTQDGEVDRHTLEMIVCITKSKLFTLIEVDHETTSDLFKCLLKESVQTCPFFHLIIECLFPFVLYQKIEKFHIYNLFFHLRNVDNIPLLENIWDVLSSPLAAKCALTLENHKLYWVFLLSGIKNTKSKKFFEALEDNFILHKFVEDDETNFFIVYTLIFEKIFQLLDKKFDPLILTKLKKLFTRLQRNSLYLNNPLEGQLIALHYAKCLSLSENKNKQKTCWNLLLPQLKNYFAYDQKWSESLVESCKYIMEHAKPTHKNLQDLISLLIVYPHCEIGPIAIQLSLKQESDCRHIIMLMFVLIKKMWVAEPDEQLVFKQIFKKYKLIALFEKIQDQVEDPFVNLQSLLCLTNPYSTHLIERTILDKLLFKNFKKYFIHFINLSHGIPEHFPLLFDALPVIKPSLNKEELKEITSILFHLCLLNYKNESDLSNFYAKIIKVNDLLELWKINPELSNSNDYTFILNEGFYDYSQIVFSHYLDDYSSGTENIKLLLISTIIRNSFKSSSNYSLKFLDMVIFLNISFIEWKNKIGKTPSAVEKTYLNSIDEFLDKSTVFLKQDFKNEDLATLRSAFCLYHTTFRSSLVYKQLNLKLLLNNLLKIPFSEGAFLMGVTLCVQFLNSLILEDAPFFMDYLLRLIEYAESFQKEYQAYFFIKIAQLLSHALIVTNQKKFHLIHRKLDHLSNKLFKTYTSFLAKRNLKPLQLTLFTKFFTTISLQLQLSLKKHSQDYLKGIAAFMTAIEHLFGFIEDDLLFSLENAQNDRIMDLLFLIPISNDCLENRAVFFNQRLAHLVKIGSLKDNQEVYLKNIQNLLKKALEKGLYKNFSTFKSRYREAYEIAYPKK